VRLHTTLGDLNLELHCELAPRTCENFIALCGMGYYDDTIFHRCIRNFMIQVRRDRCGGDFQIH
jgi:peptidyl-prolyl cis-trans isomerase-like protein 2